MNEQCIVCGKVIPEGRQVCPICNREYDGAPALSRLDNQTKICQDCGTMQALEAARALLGADMPDDKWSKFKKDFIKSMKELGNGQNTI